MPSPTSSSSITHKTKTQKEKIINMGGRITERSSSFHGKSLLANQEILNRPKTDPDLLSGIKNKINGGIFSSSSSAQVENGNHLTPRLTKLLLNVTVQRSLGPIHVVMSPESMVGDLISVVVKQYAKEGRRPSLSSINPSDFNLHYSQFSLESLDREEKLIKLGSRNFFLCPNKNVLTGSAAAAAGAITASSSNPCSNQVERVTKTALPRWCKFIDFLSITSSTL